MRYPAVVFLSVILLANAIHAESSKLNTSLKFLRQARAAGLAKQDGRRPALAAAAAEKVTVTMKFDHVLSGAEIASLEAQGAAFFRVDGAVVPYGAGVRGERPLGRDRRGRRARRRHEDGSGVAAGRLPRARRERARDRGGFGVAPARSARASPHRQRNAHIRFRHRNRRLSSFLLPRRRRHVQLDRRAIGICLTRRASDCVDLNGNERRRPNETLQHFDGWIYDPALVWGTGYPSNSGNGYQTYWDWLYNDADHDYKRDYGPAAGYTESTPSFGEQVFIALDDDGRRHARHRARSSSRSGPRRSTRR